MVSEVVCELGATPDPPPLTHLGVWDQRWCAVVVAERAGHEVRDVAFAAEHSLWPKVAPLVLPPRDERSWAPVVHEIRLSERLDACSLGRIVDGVVCRKGLTRGPIGPDELAEDVESSVE